MTFSNSLVRVELVNNITTKESQLQELGTKDIQHEAELEEIRAAL